MDCTSLQEAHFASLPSQSNIYGLTVLNTSRSTKKVLIASLKRRVFCLEYTKNSANDLIPSAREVQFTYIPSSAEIISIDAFNKSIRSRDFLIGITIMKDVENKSGIYLNIYSDFNTSGEWDLEHIAQAGCQMLELSFVPYQLTHSELRTNNGKETVWLLSGSDCKIHMYRDDPQTQCFNEQPSSDFFPEFKNILSIVYWTAIGFTESERVTAFGCEDGYISINVVNRNSNQLLRMWHIQHDSIISCLKIFQTSGVVKTPSFLKDCWKEKEPEGRDSSTWHLLVGSSIEKAVVYRDILKQGFNSQHILPESDCYDCVTAACVMDIDMDGHNEVLLGTYGQQLLVYKWVETSELYFLLWRRSFSNPLHSISFADLLGDGVYELLVLSNRGLHILQYDPEEVYKLYMKRLQFVAQKMIR